MRVVYTKHAKDKFLDKEVVKLGIKEEHIVGVLEDPIVVDKVINPHQSIGWFSKTLSLSVIWKIEKGNTKVITFYVAGKGRYESKILQGR